MKENGHKHILSLLRSPDLELREHALYCLANILFDVDSHDPRLVDCGLWDAICWILTGNLPVKSIQSPLIAMPSFPPCRSGTLLVRENVNVTVGEAFLSQGKMFVDAGRLMQAVASHNTKLPLSSEELEIIIPRIFALFTSNQPTVVNCALITLKHLSGSSEGALMISREGYIPHLIYYLEFGLKPTSSQDESRIRKALALHSAYVLTNVSAISEELSHTLSDSGILPCLKSMLARSSLSSAFVELSSRIAYNLILESVESRNKILERKLHLDVLKALRELSEKTASSSSPRNSADDKSTFQEAFLFLSLIVSNRCDAALELVEHKIGELIFTTLHNQTDAYCQFFSLTLVHSILKAAGTGGILGEFECEKGQKDLSRKDEDERREKEGFSESDIFAEMIEKPQKLENDKSLFHQEEEKLADESSQSGSSSEQLMIVKNHLQSTLAIAEVELLCESKQPLISSKASDILNEYFGTKAGSLMSVEGV
ncbi:uncharacterized protein MONOS_12670 [Monocercomonoides exilis]|uniref:uncharacterized protein n=1 Tax=Monocercomonoides exilis TaxID=2049356 RepID=UPI00355A487C|nr:hypothetical protein MONOS_12670 [Monocercomonoides exilis]|eukprot:MONOS_12670.1-p1 / transcript=MONOS_12670.1 / gene=MONOS_12670 / organism=Monocercomonoides_exilis_PA203 / gene_product=unspecified product / transcript_product=unspecified product / location=Mono_scaffold00717:13473-15149(-) / protein_length=486 / sequence_SO=supercontig / SO=protein_coding / is_pseudo=false